MLVGKKIYLLILKHLNKIYNSIWIYILENPINQPNLNGMNLIHSK